MCKNDFKKRVDEAWRLAEEVKSLKKQLRDSQYETYQALKQAQEYQNGWIGALNEMREMRIEFNLMHPDAAVRTKTKRIYIQPELSLN